MTHPAGSVDLPSEAGWNQLIYAELGVMHVTAPSGRWTIPPHRAVWIPDGEQALIVNSSATAVRNLYFSATLDVLPLGLRAMNVSSFARELILHVVRTCPLNANIPLDAALLVIFTDQLQLLPEETLKLPWPTDQRARDAAKHIVGDPTLDLAGISRKVQSSRRTLERVFTAETGLSLGTWRRRAAILGSIESLASGNPVSTTALNAGYSTPSAFVSAFRQELGHTPRNYLAR